MVKKIKDLLSYEGSIKRLAAISFKDNVVNYRIAKFKNEIAKALRNYREVENNTSKELQKQYFVLNEDGTIKMEEVKDTNGTVIQIKPMYLEGKTEAGIDKEYNEKIKELVEVEEEISEFNIELAQLDKEISAEILESLVEFIK